MWQPMRPALFERVVRYLARHYVCVQLEDYYRQPARYRTSRCCAVVFDDGYRDFMTHAWPILKKYRVPASLYVVTDCARTGQPPWTYQLDYAFLHTRQLRAEVPAGLLPAALHRTTWPSGGARRAYGQQLKPWLKTAPNAQRMAICAAILGSFADAQVPTNLMLTWRDIATLAREGVVIGSHSVSHPLLGQIEDDAELERELADSHAEIQRQLGQAPRTIAYPMGSCNDRVRRAARRVGYELGLAVGQRLHETVDEDQLHIHRLELYNESYLKTRLRMSGALERLKSVLQ